MSTRASFRETPNRFVDVGGRRLAYRRVGEGPPLVLCLRFRGVMDDWDPAFLDALARALDVIVFDYSGLGLSTGNPSYVREALARDALDLVDALGLARVSIAGWSLGGLAAQVVACRSPERVSHAVLIGSGPPGPQPYQAEEIFLPTALRPVNTLEDEIVLFFEPTAERSRAAAEATHARIAARTRELRCPLVPPATYQRLLREAHDASAIFPDPGGRYAEQLAAGVIPLLALCGDHDIVFPVENWYALKGRWNSLHVLTIPRAGHGPHHQDPELAAEAIVSFLRHVPAGVVRPLTSGSGAQLS